MQGNGDPITGAINFRSGFDAGKGKSKICKVINEGFGRFGNLVRVVRLPRPDGHQRLEFIVAPEEITL